MFEVMRNTFETFFSLLCFFALFCSWLRLLNCYALNAHLRTGKKTHVVQTEPRMIVETELTGGKTNCIGNGIHD